MTRLTDADYMKDYANKIAIMSKKKSNLYMIKENKYSKIDESLLYTFNFSDSMTVN